MIQPFAQKHLPGPGEMGDCENHDQVFKDDERQDEGEPSQDVEEQPSDLFGGEVPQRAAYAGCSASGGESFGGPFTLRRISEVVP